MAVADEPSRRVDDLFAKGVGVGTFAIVVAHELECEKAHNIDENDGYCHRSHYIFSLFKTIIFGHKLRSNAVNATSGHAQWRR